MKNPCETQRAFCKNCHDHYSQLRPSIKGSLISNTFDEDDHSVIDDILECSNMHHTELHKYEKRVDGNLIFRAKVNSVHIVYAIDKERKLILFLRSFGNFVKYKKFLEDDKEIIKTISRMY